MLAISRAIDKINETIGKAASWLILFAVLFAVYNALVRKIAINLYSNLWVDAQWMLFSATFLLCAPWTLFLNEHIRIDVLSERMKPKTRHIIEIVGHVLILIPFCLVMIWISWPWAMKGYLVGEISQQFGGLPPWPAKFLVPLAFFLLLMQAFSELIKRIYILRGKLDDPFAKNPHSSYENIAEEAAGGKHE